MQRVRRVVRWPGEVCTCERGAGADGGADDGRRLDDDEVGGVADEHGAQAVREVCGGGGEGVDGEGLCRRVTGMQAARRRRKAFAWRPYCTPYLRTEVMSAATAGYSK